MSDEIRRDNAMGPPESDVLGISLLMSMDFSGFVRVSPVEYA